MKNVEDVYPLSPGQQGVLFHALNAKATGVYVEQLSWTIAGELDPAVLKRAWQEVVERHPALRTAFLWEGLDEPLQVVRARVELNFEHHDWRNLTAAEQESKIAELHAADRRRGFDLTRAPLMRLTLVERAPGAYWFLWSFHHLIMDGWSYNIVLREAFQVYSAWSRNQPPGLSAPPRYRQYIAWLRRQDMASAEPFWRRQLAGFTSPTPLAGAHSGDGAGGTALGERRLPAERTARIASFAARNRLTLNNLCQGAWALLLAHSSGERDVVFGGVTAARPPALAGSDQIVGYFINTLPVRVAVPFAEPVGPWLAGIRDLQVRMQAHEHVPLARVQQWSEVERGARLFESLLVFENVPAIDAGSGDLRSASLEFTDPRYHGDTDYALSLMVSPGERLHLRLFYDRGRFRGADVRRMLTHLETLLMELSESAERRLGELRWMSPAELHQVVREWNDSGAELPSGASFLELFGERAAERGDAVAVTFREVHLSYRELDRRAARLAGLLSAQGAGREAVVALLAERSPAFLTAVLGIFKAGAAYLPLDPQHPPRRLGQILDSSGARLALADGALRGPLSEAAGALEVDRRPRISDLAALVSGRGDTSAAGPAVGPSSLAYVIYTSGSTGTPKGAMVEQRGMLNHLWVKVADLGVTDRDVVAQTASQCFDISVWQFLSALLSGGRVHIVPDDVTRDPARLVDEIDRAGVTVFETVPSLLSFLLEEATRRGANRGRFETLRWLIPTGEALPPDLGRRWLEAYPEIPLVNAYGPTECSDDVTHHVLRSRPAGPGVPIGRPVANLRLHALDARGRPAPQGVTGELFVGGVGVGRGYLGEARRTAEAFGPDPFSGGACGRLYRTGDLGRWTAEGVLEFLGRRDHQVKVRGFRIELGEIESALDAHPAVRAAVVDVCRPEGGPHRLAAWVVRAEGGELTAADLRDHLGASLPEYMVPALFLFLDALPRTATGKVDRRALEAPDAADLAAVDSAERRSPRTPVEELLAGIWARVLGRRQVGIDDNFFELGGDSILSLQVVSQARKAGLVLTPQQVFQNPTIADLAVVAHEAPGSRAEQYPVTGPVGLTPIQAWFFESGPVGVDHFNQAVLLETAERLDPAVLGRTLERLLEHHDALRLRFAREGSVWRQEMAGPGGEVPFSHHDLCALPEGRRREGLTAIAGRLQASLDTSRGPLLRLASFDLGQGQPGRLLMIVHHLAVDGYSWRVLLEDLFTVHSQLARGAEPRLPAKTTSFKKWSARLSELADSPGVKEELPFWLEGPWRRLRRLPVDVSEAPHGDVEASSRNVTATLDAEETRRLLAEVPGVLKARVDELLLAALAVALRGWTGQDLLLFDIERHGREAVEDLDVSRTVGWFTVLHPLLLEIGTGSGLAVLRRVKERLRRVPGGGRGFGLLRYLAAQGDDVRRLRELPGAQIRFNYLGQLDRAVAEDAVGLEPADEPVGAGRDPERRRRYLLEVDGRVIGGRLELVWTYSREAHRRDTVAAVAGACLEALRGFASARPAGAETALAPSDFPYARVDQAAIERWAASGRELEDVYALSPMQEGMFFHALRDAGSTVYFEQLGATFQGILDAGAFRRAWERVVERHPVLRTGFFHRGLEEPVQVVFRRFELDWRELDWRDHTPARRRAAMEELLEADREAGFELGSPPLLRLVLLRTGERTHRLVWSFHHLLLDGWSLPLVLSEVMGFYESFRRNEEPATEPKRPYRDYIAWLAGQDPAAAEAFWRRTLAGISSPTPLPADRSADPGEVVDPAQLEHRMPAAATAPIEAMARRRGLTLNTVLAGAWAALLARYSGESDVVFGATVSGRSAPIRGVDRMIGLLINTIPVRAQATPAGRLGPWLGQLQERQAEARRHELTPLVEIQGWSDVPAGGVLFESLLVFENYPIESSLRERSGSLEISGIEATESTNYPLTVVAAPGQGLLLKLLYDRRRFDATTVGRILGHLRTLVAGLDTLEQAALSELPLLSAAERHQVASEWSGDAVVDRCRLLIPELFEHQVDRAPDAVAVVEGPRHVSYRGLDSGAEALARRLRARGVGPEKRVGIPMRRSLEVSVAMLGVMKAGGVYVPFDLSYPETRLCHMLAEARLSLLLDLGGVPAKLRASKVPTLELGAADGEDQARVENRLGGLNTAYVLFTSGSTGRPKGVEFPHLALANLVVWQVPRYRPAGRTLQFAALSFDASLHEMLATWCSGGKLIVPPDTVKLDPRLLLQQIERDAIERIHLPFVALQQLAESATEAGIYPESLRELFTAGERLQITPPLRRFIEALPGCRLINQYGPTETHVSTNFELPGPPGGWRTLPAIGTSIDNSRNIVLDRLLRPVPAGVTGEIFIGGDVLARGYLRRPSRTAERFIPDPSGDAPGARLYRSGDLGRNLSDGSIDFQGRNDHQVKIRGFRVEPGEIEVVLSGHPDVREAVVIARAGESGGLRLVAFAVADEGRAIDTAALRAFLRERMPDYMVPAAFVAAESLPRTPSGKVDRRALGCLEQPPEAAAPSAAPPRTPLEEMVAGIWSQVLSTSNVGIDEDFFELGGHSLIATRLISRLRDAAGVELPVRALFEAPTIAGLAACVDAALRGAAGVIAPPVRPAPRGVSLPLSFAQERLWFFDQFEPGSSVYNLAHPIRIRGRLDVEALASSLVQVVRRHRILRTAFVAEQGHPIQRASRSARLDLGIVDLEGLPAPARERSLRCAATEEAGIPFDLASGPPLRAVLVRLGEADHALLLTMHHIVSDGWSIAILVRELMAFYGSLTAGRASAPARLPIQYADFAHWQRGWLAGEVFERLLSYWTGQLAGAPQVLELATDRPRPAVQSFRGDRAHLELAAPLTGDLERLSRRAGATLFMTLMAGYMSVLGRYARKSDVLVGTLVANRDRTEIEDLIGFFVNTLILRGDLSRDPSFSGLLARVRRAALGGFAHQDLPFEKLVEELQPERDLSHSPLFQALFVMQSVAAESLAVPGLEISDLAIDFDTAKFDLSLSMERAGGGLGGVLIYRSDLFDETTIRRFLGHWRGLLASAAADPERRLSQLSLLDRVESHQLLLEWNDPQLEHGAGPTIHELFEGQVKRTPERVAVLFEGAALSYAALDSRAERLASGLVRAGVRSEDLVGVLLERSFELVAGLMGVLKAGGAYVPLDPDYPRERLELMLEDSHAAVLLTEKRLAARAPGFSGRVIRVDAAGPPAAGAAPPAGVGPDNLAYVIYTSGSTGLPKGVMISHRGICNRFQFAAAAGQVRSSDRFLQKTSISFDVSLLEIFMPLIAGGSTVLVRPGDHGDVSYLVRLMSRQRVTQAVFPPSLFQVLLSDENIASCTALRSIACSAEAMPVGLRKMFFDHLDAELYNRYGPTEASVAVTSWRCEPLGGRTIPIGRPIAKADIRVLDPAGGPAPLGVPGELSIGGIPLGRGYFRRPAATAASFVPDALSERRGERLYRTGDLARHRRDGAIEFLGRLDFQVKIRGFRVELGEIDAALETSPALLESVVAARQDGPIGLRLVAYVVPRQEAALDVDDLKAFLKRRLPHYMVPAAFVVLDALPRTPNGKVDRRALPAPATETGGGHARPRTPVEEILVELWSSLLEVETVGIDEDFFELGGHSLLATQLMSRIRSKLDVDLPLRALFEGPTVAELAVRVEEARRRALGVHIPPLVPVERGAELPLSFAQQRIWFLNQIAPGNPALNMPSAIRLRGRLEAAALVRSLEEIVRRHEILRTGVETRKGRPVQVVQAAAALEMPTIDLASLPRARREGEADALASAAASRSFDLARAPMVRAGLIRLAADEHMLLLTMHHIVSDGWSVGVFVRELAALYRARLEGRSSPLEELPIQYADFAQWQHDWLQGEALEVQLGYWTRQLDRSFPALDLPVDRPRPAMMTFRGAHCTTRFAASLTGRLRELAARQGATLFMTLLAGFEALVAHYSGQRRFLVGSPIAHRNREEVENLIGIFFNLLALRADLRGDPSFSRLIERTREVTLGAYAHQDLPFERLLDELQPERTLDRTPLFQVSFVLQNAPLPPLELPGLSLALKEFESGTSNFDLTLFLTESAGGLRVAAEYRTELFDETTVVRMMRHLRELLEAATGDPGLPVSRLPLLSGQESFQILSEWNDTRAGYSEGLLIHQLFEEQVRRAPEAVAAVYAGRELTYRALDQWSNRLARLLRSFGVGPGEWVAVLLERSLEMVPALLGVLKAGGAYVPLEPAYPAARVQYILSSLGVRQVLTQEGMLGLLECLEPAPEISNVVLLDTSQPALESCARAKVWDLSRLEPLSPETLPVVGRSGDLAYVIFTSGSTGTPKGVMVRHRPVVNLIEWVNRRFGIGPGDRVLFVTSLCFDLSVYDVFGLLAGGGTIRVASAAEVGDPEALVGVLVGEPVTFWDSAPAALQQLVAFLPDGAQPAGRPALRLVFQSGDWIPLALPDQIRSVFPEAAVVSLGGATEATVWSNFHPVGEIEDHWVSIPYGRPMPNARYHVLGAGLGPCPPGVEGDLFIGGHCLASGYVGAAALTAEKFIPDPYTDERGQRLYRTGDRARHWADGTLEFRGRLDHQVKVRGFRIELGEIETVLAEQPEVRDAVVLAREDVPGDKRLVAYVVATGAMPEVPVDGEHAGAGVGEWREIYDQTYSQSAAQDDPTFNTVGWISSFTGEPIPAEEMREWLGQTVDRILAIGSDGAPPRRVLELGCGTGMLLFRVAPHCEAYHGTDISEVGLANLERLVGERRGELGAVTLERRAAHEWEGVEPGEFDAVVLNSVTQHFPDADYLLEVIEQAVDKVAPGGSIFIGDVRSHSLLEAFCAAVSLARSPDSLPSSELARQVRQRLAMEEELVVAPDFFHALPRRLPRLRRVAVQLKRGLHHNELTRFRYDVVLTVGGGEPAARGWRWLDWADASGTLAALRRRLEAGAEALGVRAVPNRRLAREVELVRLLESAALPKTAGELRRELEAVGSGAVDPEELWALGRELGYRVEVTWSGAGGDGLCDALFWPAGSPRPDAPERLGIPESQAEIRWRDYTNDARRGKLARQLVPELRRRLAERLPDYMVPSAFVVIDALPVTANGKVDRRALPAPAGLRPELEAAFVAPESDVEELLAKVWCDVLGVDRIGVHDNFFELGGDSVLSIQVIARANQSGFRINPGQLFQHQTIAELATVVEVGLSTVAEQGEVTGAVALLPIQEWFFRQELEERHHWNLPVLIGARIPIDPSPLAVAFEALLRHHDALRLRFSEDESGWRQENAPYSGPAPVHTIDLSGLAPALRSPVIEAACHAAQPSLDLERGPLFRLIHFDLRGSTIPSRLFLLCHHLVTDGVSWRILLEDLQTAYGRAAGGRAAGGRAVELPPKTTSYRAWSETLRRHVGSGKVDEEWDFWLDARRRKVPSLPVDTPGGLNTEGSIETVVATLDAAETAALLLEVPEAYHTQINDVLLAALTETFERWTGQTTLLVDLEGHGREDLVDGLDLSRTVGWCTAIYPVLLDVTDAVGRGEKLKSVKEQLRRIPRRGIGYPLLRYLSEDRERRRRLEEMPQAEVIFNYLGQFDQAVSETSLFAPAQEGYGSARCPHSPRYHRIEIWCSVLEDRLRVHWNYSGDLHRRATIERRAEDFLDSLKGFIDHCTSPEAGGFTPSDFAGASLSQASLDSLISKIG